MTEEKSIVKQDFSLTNEDWYNAILDECQAIMVEREFNSRMEIIQGKWELGERISNDKGFHKFGKGNRQFINQLAKDLSCSENNIYFSIQFYEKFPDLNKAIEALPEGKNVSWYQITQKYLGNRDEKKVMDRKVFKVKEIVDSFKVFLRDELSFNDDNEIDVFVEKFRTYLSNLKKK